MPRVLASMHIAQMTIHAVDGPALATCSHRGHDYVGGEVGQRYNIRVANNTGGPILAIVTVDGLNVIGGSPGSYDGGGMIIPARGAEAFKGWRTGLADVAAFRMGDAENSYAATQGNASNVGVIGLAVFQAKRRHLDLDPVPTSRPAVRGSATRSMGTSFGESVSSPVTTATFDRATSSPAQIQTIRYDSIDALVAAGIMPSDDGPNAFPGNPSAQFCAVPR